MTLRKDFRNTFRLIIVLVMVVAFLYQMWELFGQFLSGLTTVAISIEEKEEYELPSFAFCDTRAFTKSVSMEETFTNYNGTTFDMDKNIEFHGVMKTDGKKINYLGINHTTQLVPTFFNGYCKLYEFQQRHAVNTYIGKKIVRYSNFYKFPTFDFQNLLCLKTSLLTFSCLKRALSYH